MSTSGPPEPRVSKSRLPRAYTEEQLSFLRNNLNDFERKSQGSIRGDAKKFALEKASEFIVRFGIPPDVESGPDVDVEAKFKEQIYNWFKNTVGRTRRKLEGKSRIIKKSVDADSPVAGSSAVNWNTNLASPTIIPYTNSHGNPDQLSTPTPSSAPISYAGNPSNPPSSTVTLNLNPTTLSDAFLTPGIDPSTLSSMLQSYAMSHPSPTPLTPVILALFDAITAAESRTSSSSRLSGNSACHTLLRRFVDACSYFPPTITHAAVSGPAAGPRAIQMLLRKCSIWLPNSPVLARLNSSPTLPSSMTDEMQRIAADRQRRKNYIQWARIHGAALELGILGNAADGAVRAFSESMARDSVWEDEEVEWVAGVCILRALIRTALGGDVRQRDEYRELFRAYEERWKEIRDESRQELVTDFLVDAKQGLMALDDQFMS